MSTNFTILRIFINYIRRKKMFRILTHVNMLINQLINVLFIGKFECIDCEDQAL